MILSHRYRFIFLKTAKTAGTSVELSLSRFCGPDDVVTAVHRDDEAIRAQTGGVGPQHDDRRAGVRALERRDLRTALRTRRWPRRRVFRAHTPAAALRELIPTDVWDSYHKVAFVRNPWDRAISAYYWDVHRGLVPPDFDAWLDLGRERSGWRIYTIDDEVVVDQMGRFESLTADVADICERVGIPFDAWLPHSKGGIRADTRHYREVLTPAQATTIGERCAREIEEFGYEF
jgi:Sulfotransferase family